MKLTSKLYNTRNLARVKQEAQEIANLYDYPVNIYESYHTFGVYWYQAAETTENRCKLITTVTKQKTRNQRKHNQYKTA